MSRNLKALGLALVACLALSGIAAVAAHAETAIESTLAAPNETTLDVTNDTNEHGKLARLTIGNGARFVECTSLKISGVKFIKTITTATGTPEFAECFSNGLTTAPATVTHNGCKFKVTVKTTNTGEVTGEGCTNIEVHVFENVKAQEEKKSLCTYDIAEPQTVTGGAVKNAGGAGTAMDITAELAGTSKLQKITNTGAGGVAVCGLAVGAVGTGAFSGNLTITGTTAAGAAAGVTVI